MEDKTTIWILSIIGFCMLAGITFFLLSCKAKSTSNQKLNRGDYLKQAEELDQKYQTNINNKKVRLELAQKLFEVGEFDKSQELVQPLLKGENPPVEAHYLSAHIEYLHGRYARAEKILELLAQTSSADLKMKAQLGLLFTSYQTNQYAKAQNLFKGLEGKIQLPLWDLMKAFGNEKPYQLDWKGKNRTVVPFLVTDPLPIVAVKINGKPINVIIDTGGEIFYLDEMLAASLGIKPIARQVEPYAGGKTVEVGYARIDSLTIGEVTLNSIPIKLGSIQRFSEIFSNQFAISGILTTGILQQFLATIDYPEGQLILRARNEESRNNLINEFTQKKITSIPFVLSLTHLMICKGSINDRGGLNLFIDSGLADSEAALCLPKQTLDYLGIPPPVTKVDPNAIGGLAGGGFPVGRFTIEKCGLGSLNQNATVGLYGIFPPELYHECEFIVDGLISHQFLKKYNWTIDFDAMIMIFGQ
jgi:hypothetical protein